jgi:hypothetical protein
LQSGDDIPQDIAAVIGDALNNMRSALDLALSGLALDLGVKNLSNINFPTAKNANSFESVVKNGLKGKLAKLVGSFLAELQPYKGGNHGLLRSLHELDRHNKHRVIVPVATPIIIQDEAISKGLVIPLGPEHYIADGAIVAITPPELDYQVGDEASLTIQIAFDNTAPAERG